MCKIAMGVYVYMIVHLWDNMYIFIRVYVCMHMQGSYGCLCIYDSSPVGQYVDIHKCMCVCICKEAMGVYVYMIVHLWDNEYIHKSVCVYAYAR